MCPPPPHTRTLLVLVCDGVWDAPLPLRVLVRLSLRAVVPLPLRVLVGGTGVMGGRVGAWGGEGRAALLCTHTLPLEGGLQSVLGGTFASSTVSL